MTTNPISPLPIARRSMFFSGLWLLIGRPGAVLWAFALNLEIALLFSLRLHMQLKGLLDHAIAAQPLLGGFDMPTAIVAMSRLSLHTPSGGWSPFAGLPVWLLVYFLLVPGALFCYRVKVRAGLGTMLHAGIGFFWRFVRITVLTVLVSGLVLGPLVALNNLWTSYVDDHVVGVSAYWHKLPGLIVILLVASALRLYFDLVEAYTVQLDGQYRLNGKPDRRVRRALIPAAKVLLGNLTRALVVFVVLAVAGAAALAILTWMALHTLGQPRTWPAFLLVQAGLVINLAMRFWQRAAETVLVADHPIAWEPVLHPGATIAPGCAGYLYPRPAAASDPMAVHHPVDRLVLAPNPIDSAPVDSGMRPPEILEVPPREEGEA